MSSILQWNIRGLESNREQLQLLVKQFTPLVLCLQECLSPSVSFSPFQVVSSLNKNEHFRGISLLCHSSVLASPVSLDTPLEAVAARVSLGKTVTICCLYLSPSQSFDKKMIGDLVDQLPRPFLLLGDFNGHSPLWGSDCTSARGLMVEELLDEFGLSLFNDGSPTHYTSFTNKFSHLDLSICDPSLLLDFDWKVHDDLCGSDHFPIILSSDTPAVSSNRKNFVFKNVNWDAFSVQCSAVLTEEEVFSSNDPIDNFTHLLMQCANDTIPKQSCKLRRPKTPWFDEECKALNKKRKKAQRAVFQSPTAENVQKHQRLRAQTRFLFKNKKKQSWKNFCSKLNSQTPPRTVWNIIRKIKGKGTKPSVPHLKSAGKLITSKGEVANLIASTLEENSSGNRHSAAFNKHKTEAEKVKLNFQSDNTENYNSPFSLTELKEALLKSNDSAPGHDEVHYSLLRHLPHSCLLVLLKVFNHVWENESFPASWRKAVIVPIPKPGKDHSDPANFRPIALTSCLCKTMERMINTRLLWKLESEGLLTPVQCGFRKNRSTVDHLIRFESFIRGAFVKKQHAVAIFFDLEKAYDTTWKFGIMSDLFKLGFRGHLPIFIKNFLADRSFQVRVGSTLSDTHQQELGVPQGSILSPLLFCIKLNEIVKSVQADTECALFVDDFALCARGSTLARVERQLQLCVNKIQDWIDGNGFKFSVKKTECIHFHKFRDIFPDPQIYLNKSPITAVREAKFLGLIFDKSLNFKSHIQYLKTSCQKALNVLRVVGHTNWGADKCTLLKLYRSLVRSKLDYGCMIYGSTRDSYLKSLDAIHHQGLRIALGAFRTSPVYSLYAEAGECSLEHRRIKLSMNYYLRLSSSPENPAYQCVFNPPFKTKFEQSPSCLEPFGLRILQHVEDAEIDSSSICTNNKVSETPSWHLESANVNFDLTQHRKQITSNVVYKQSFLEMCANFPNHRKIFTDGSKTDEGVGCAALSFSETKPKKLSLRLPADASIYTAELKALILALKLAYQSTEKSFLILSDSLSALQAIASRSFGHPLLFEFHELHTSLLHDNFNICFAWVPSHVGIRGNEMVDNIAKESIEDEVSSTGIPYSDCRRKVNQYIQDCWQLQWNIQTDNKLHSIKPQLSDTLQHTVKNRREESVLCRLHIGHSFLSHSYLLKRESPPECIPCNERLTIRHLLLDCVDTQEIRTKYYTASSLQVLFRNIPPDKIFQFLREIHVFHLL